MHRQKYTHVVKSAWDLEPESPRCEHSPWHLQNCVALGDLLTFLEIVCTIDNAFQFIIRI